MKAIRAAGAGVVIVAILPWTSTTEAQPAEPVRTYPASTCVQQYGQDDDY